MRRLREPDREKMRAARANVDDVLIRSLDAGTRSLENQATYAGSSQKYWMRE